MPIFPAIEFSKHRAGQIADSKDRELLVTEIPPIPAGPLTPEHLRQLAEARARARKILRASAIAAFSGWSMAVFAFLTLVFAIFSDWSAWAIGVGLALCAANEIRGGAKVRKMEPRGAVILGWNQFFLAGLIVSYALWSLYRAVTSPALSSMLQSTGDPSVDALAKNLVAIVSWALYGTMAVVGLLVPGLTAVYYFSRKPLVERFRSETPAWVLEVVRQG